MVKLQKNIDFLVIAGPTAVGKSEFAINLAKKYNGEIINADSVQIYRELNIGSAKVSSKEMQGIPHHLIDIKNPEENYSVYDFQKDCLTKISEISQRKKIPIIVGGTGLYLNSIIYEYNLEKNENNEKTKEIMKLLELKTNQELYDIVKAECQKEQIEIHVNNRYRLINYAYKVITKQKLKQKELKQRNCQIIALYIPRKELYKKIDKRVDEMFEKGLIEEVEKFDSGWNSQKSIGYKETHQYLEGKLSKIELIEKIKKNTRNYAKRQMTWLNNKVTCQWYEKEGDIWQLMNK